MPESVLFAIVGGVVGLLTGALLGWIVAKLKAQGQTQLAEKKLLESQSQFDLRLLEEQKNKEALAEQYQQSQAIYQQLQQRFDTLQEQKQALETQQAVVASQLSQLQEIQKDWSLNQKSDFEAFMQKSLNEVQNKLKEEAVNDIAQRQKVFDEKLSLLVKPLSETVTNYQKDVQKYYATLDEQVKLNAEQLKQTAQAANKLSTALNSNQARGNWGEVELMRILELSGLKQGISYFSQEVLANNKKPDVRVLLPDNRNIFIDAKSLKLDLELLSEDEYATPEMQKAKQKKIATALDSAIKSLDGREYIEQLPKNQSASFIILFVPRESMLSEALAVDMKLFEKAYEKGIILSGPFNLLAMLKMIHHGWSMAKLSEDAEKILELGTALYKQAVTFATHFDQLGKDIDKLAKNHGEAFRAFVGNQGLVKKIHALEDYGLSQKATKPLPKDFYETKETVQTSETLPLLMR